MLLDNRGIYIMCADATLKFIDYNVAMTFILIIIIIIMCTNRVVCDVDMSVSRTHELLIISLASSPL